MVVWLWVCGCAGVWEVFIMYGCTLARERGKQRGRAHPSTYFLFPPHGAEPNLDGLNPNAWQGLGGGPGDVLPTFYQGEKVSSRRPFQRGSRETEGMLHAE